MKQAQRTSLILKISLDDLAETESGMKSLLFRVAGLFAHKRSVFWQGRHPNRYGQLLPPGLFDPTEKKISIAEFNAGKKALFCDGTFLEHNGIFGRLKADLPPIPGEMDLMNVGILHDNFFMNLIHPLSRNGADPEIILKAKLLPV